ncbi:MAG: NAD(P)-dependent oxidoreductase [Chloroflexi bacterium]|nr:NAD(P)-dependent oxidoreductase [Chloroflexota bacterium]MCL5275555.1 NAD(P)-dependent oxidoreductase [Chloroflexota bacterium]
MILVTGANGFIGREVCRVLTSHRHELVATDRSCAANTPYRFVAGDVCDSDWLADLFRAYAFEAIIHLASMRNRESQSRPADAMRINIGGSLSLLGLAAQHGAARFVYASSISAYGPKPYARYGEVAESEPAAPDNVYGLAKRYVEMAGEQAQREGRLSFVALRIAMVVGAGVVSTASMWRGEIFDRLPISQPYVIRLPYAHDEVLPLIHAMDVAEMLQRLAMVVMPRHMLYNTPADHCTCADLADAVTALNPHISFTFDSVAARGDPEKIDGRRFQNEFDYPLPSIRQRLRQAV